VMRRRRKNNRKSCPGAAILLSPASLWISAIPNQLPQA
jgi:hypothetical protein